MLVEDKYEGPRLENGKVTLKFMQVNKELGVNKPQTVGY
jgi:hypothetical protein